MIVATLKHFALLAAIVAVWTIAVVVAVLLAPFDWLAWTLEGDE